MPILEIKPPGDGAYDLLALGEIMLRLDPGEGRVRTAREFKVWEGGGEYNVARGLRRCFGLKTAVCTAFAENDVGRLLEDFILQGGVGTEFIKWRPDDGVGRTVRNGLNFTERGFGLRGAVGIPDRGHTAASQLKPGDFDWDHIFGKLGVRWLHTGGIFAALSDTTPKLVIEAVQKAKQHGTIVSYDLNYRPSLWKSIGGQKRAQEVNREIARYVDRRRFARSARRPATTGEPFAGRAASFMKRPTGLAWKSWTASAAATVLLPDSFTASWRLATRRWRWNTGRRTARWP